MNGQKGRIIVNLLVPTSSDRHWKKLLDEANAENTKLLEQLADAQHDLKGAEAMCEMQMAINRELQAQLKDAHK